MADSVVIRLRNHSVSGARPDWAAVFYATFVPHVEWKRSYMSVLVGVLGTTISPYLFFWQAAQEVEEDRKQGKVTVAQRRGSTNRELRVASDDVLTGMFISNLVMFFIVLTTAATLIPMGSRTSKRRNRPPKRPHGGRRR